LLATSGAIAIVLGLALQSTLGDLFSGLVLNFSKPYRPGDWINLEGGTSGRVIEMNWRATHVLTARQDLAIVPNSTIAKSKIVNVSSPSGIHGVAIAIQLDTRTPPSIGTEILERALLNCRLVLGTPAPTVAVKSITAAYIEFEITFFVEDLALATQAQNELFDLIFRHLTASGLDLASAAPPRRPSDRLGRRSAAVRRVRADDASPGHCGPTERRRSTTQPRPRLRTAMRRAAQSQAAPPSRWRSGPSRHQSPRCRGSRGAAQPRQARIVSPGAPSDHR
jgi:small-conductance mechanosensitive channel